jgi:hypothetical protein
MIVTRNCLLAFPGFEFFEKRIDDVRCAAPAHAAAVHATSDPGHGAPATAPASASKPNYDQHYPAYS